MHGGIGQILEVYRNVPFPDAQTFVVRSGDKPTIVVDECNGVDSAYGNGNKCTRRERIYIETNYLHRDRKMKERKQNPKHT